MTRYAKGLCRGTVPLYLQLDPLWVGVYGEAFFAGVGAQGDAVLLGKVYDGRGGGRYGGYYVYAVAGTLGDQVKRAAA